MQLIMIISYHFIILDIQYVGGLKSTNVCVLVYSVIVNKTCTSEGLHVMLGSREIGLDF